ncbi:MAG: response regulator [Patescibacteria group bacterium]
MAQKILIIEDEKVLMELICKKLEKEGYAVETAGDGESGLRKMRETKPDLVLLDIVMPKMNGFEVLETANQDQTLKTIPVIILSNSGQLVELDQARALGVRDWLIKTEFDPQEVVEKVIKQIGAPK